MADNLSMKNIWELHDYSFTIPYQQRGYKWTEYNIINLLQDLTDYISSGKGFYCLQPIAIVPIDKSSNHYSIIDGQQLFTFCISSFFPHKLILQKKQNYIIMNMNVMYQMKEKIFFSTK